MVLFFWVQPAGAESLCDAVVDPDISDAAFSEMLQGADLEATCRRPLVRDAPGVIFSIVASAGLPLMMSDRVGLTTLAMAKDLEGRVEALVDAGAPAPYGLLDWVVARQRWDLAKRWAPGRTLTTLKVNPSSLDGTLAALDEADIALPCQIAPINNHEVWERLEPLIPPECFMASFGLLLRPDDFERTYRRLQPGTINPTAAGVVVPRLIADGRSTEALPYVPRLPACEHRSLDVAFQQGELLFAAQYMKQRDSCEFEVPESAAMLGPEAFDLIEQSGFGPIDRSMVLKRFDEYSGPTEAAHNLLRHPEFWPNDDVIGWMSMPGLDPARRDAWFDRAEVDHYDFKEAVREGWTAVNLWWERGRAHPTVGLVDEALQHGQRDILSSMLTHAEHIPDATWHRWMCEHPTSAAALVKMGAPPPSLEPCPWRDDLVTLGLEQGILLELVDAGLPVDDPRAQATFADWTRYLRSGAEELEPLIAVGFAPPNWVFQTWMENCELEKVRAHQDELAPSLLRPSHAPKECRKEARRLIREITPTDTP